jgi:sulfide:quinone oxidoreductase
MGDVAAVGTPRAGVFAEGHAKVAAQHISAALRGASSDAQYGGHGICYLEFGAGELAMVDVTFFGDKRTGALVGPSRELSSEKAAFGSSRIKRWFDKDWQSAEPAERA